MRGVLLFFCYCIAQTGAFVQERFSHKELLHIFGVAEGETLPEYWLDHPERLQSDGKHLYKLTFDGETYHFDLRANHELFAEGFHAIEHSDNASTTLHLSVPENHCTFKGSSTSHNNTILALVGCDSKSRGMLITEAGEFILIHPVPDRHVTDGTKNRHPHIIHKRSTAFNVMDPRPEGMNKPCLFEARDDPFPNEEEAGPAILHSHDRLPILKGPLIIELGVFADDAMWQHFRELYGHSADEELQRFILAAANNIHLLYGHNTIEPKINVEIVRYEVMKRPPTQIRRSVHKNGEVDRLLEGFCEYQSNINPISDSDPRHWDHALLFSGYDLYRGRLQSVAGYAPVKGMCSGIRSCTINEGLDFGAVFVITHEMGHSLGMYHDGDNGCDPRCCIMSPSVGSGKTSWSRCSIQEFTLFVNRLGTGLLPTNCLMDGGNRRALDHELQGQMPGQRYTLDQQCRIFHGDCWAHELRDGQTLSDVCEMVWCGAGEGIIRTTHPALEGTYCGIGKWCFEGRCQLIRGQRPPSAVHGGWSAWNDSPRGTSCGATGCSQCEISGQMRVRKSIRLCDNPAPNNGGSTCKGSQFRAELCSKRACSANPQPDQYATKVCTDLRNSADTPDLLLSGRGFQYEQQPCKVWCHMQLNSFIRTVGNFPDGTPCGPSGYCVKGSCQKLACNGKAIVEDARKDCPSNSVPARQQQTSSLRPRETWGQWSQWTSCSRTCSRGVRQRERACLGRVCSGSSKEREVCEESVCPVLSFWTEWSVWGQCSVSCGGGSQRRNRACTGGRDCVGSSIETRNCGRDACPVEDTWSTWGTWARCSQTCGGGQQVRRRECKARVCHGRSTDSRSCNTRICEEKKEETNFLDQGARWSSWTEWSQCTRTCGGGNRFRRRRCHGEGICFGSSVTFSTCKNRDCIDFLRDIGHPSSWNSWTAWSSCTQTCGGGSQRRTRVCNGSPGNPCRGSSSTSRSCNSKTCDTDASSWSSWGPWHPCSCRTHRQQRYRRCNGEDPCLGSWVEQRHCEPSALC